jgi:Predicted NADH:ubiquinone oxidoreductase, subunit RnfE
MNNIPGLVYKLDFLILVLGICPLLGGVTTLKAGVVMAAMYAVTCFTIALILALIRNLIPYLLRLTVILLLAATVVTVNHLLMQAFMYEYSLMTGILRYLIAVSCLLLTFAEEEWLSNTIPASLTQAVFLSAGVFMLLVLIGLVREYIPLNLFHQPPGAFLLLAMLLAAAQWFAARDKQASFASA